jgi:hypothetical protein
LHVRSGYPIWNLVGDWIAQHCGDEAVIQDYHLDPDEWAAAKQYYLDHKAVIDARLIVNQEPLDHEIEPGISTPDEFFAWAERVEEARTSELMHRVSGTAHRRPCRAAIFGEEVDIGAVATGHALIVGIAEGERDRAHGVQPVDADRARIYYPAGYQIGGTFPVGRAIVRGPHLCPRSAEPGGGNAFVGHPTIARREGERRIIEERRQLWNADHRRQMRLPVELPGWRQGEGRHGRAN